MGKETRPKKITFHYQKTGSFRTHHVDGATGALTPNGKIYMELFTESLVTQEEETYKLTAKGKLGEIESSKGPRGVMRQIEAGIIMDIGVAEALRDFIDINITEFLGKQAKKS